MKKMDRRRFLKTTAGAAGIAAAAPVIIPSSALGADGAVAPSNRIVMGSIGVGNMGSGDLRSFLGDERVQVVAVCDVERESNHYWAGRTAGREPARRAVEQRYASQKASGKYKGCDAYVDFRELLARTDIDAVHIAIPDHWHALAVVTAARAGKDIYCQKPLSLTIHEGRVMSNTVKQHGRVFQTGSQQRSDGRFRHVCELARNGYLGEIHTVRCGLPGGTPDVTGYGDRKSPEPVPGGFEYNLWLGPAPWATYCTARCHSNFRWNLDYSGGQITDWGGHHPDIAQWGLGTMYTGPVEIRNAHGEFSKDPLWNTATDYYFECIYKDGTKLIYSNKERGGVTFEGTEGWAWVTRGNYDADPKSLLDLKLKPNDTHLRRSNNHYRDFIDAVIERCDPVAPIEQAHRSITLGHLGNIALRLGREKLLWDPDEEKILDDPEASRMLERPYRAPWTLGA